MPERARQQGEQAWHLDKDPTKFLADELPTEKTSMAGNGNTAAGVSEPVSSPQQTTLFVPAEGEQRGRTRARKKFLEANPARIGTFRHDINKVKKPQDPAQILAPIGTRAQETLAYLVSDSPQHGLVRRLIAAVKRFLVEHGISERILNKMDLQALAQGAVAREAKTGGIKNITPNKKADIEQVMASMSKALGISQKQLQAEYNAVRDRFKGTDRWLKAPNGEDSNLPEHLWVLVRTPRFKAWFGNWEMNRDKKIPVEVISERMFGGDRKKAKQWLLDQENGVIGVHNNNETGMKISVTRASIKRKGTSGKALAKSMTNDHYEVLRALPNLINNASIVAAEPEAKRPEHIVGVYKFVVPARVGDKVYSVKLSKRLCTWSREGTRVLYTELVEIEMPRHPVAGNGGNSREESTRGPGIPSTYRLGELVDVVNRKEPDAIPEQSKVI